MQGGTGRTGGAALAVSNEGVPVVMRVLQTLGSIACRPALAAVGILLLALAGCATRDKPQTVDVSELVWPRPPEQPRIKFLKSFSFRADVQPNLGSEQVLSALLGASEDRGERLKKPYGVHADKDGRIFVADTGWGKVVVFDTVANKFSFWGTEGKGQLTKPAGITSDSAGRIYVTDIQEKRLVVFGPDGKFLSAMGRKGELESPVGVAIDENLGRIYVVDSRKHDIAVFDMDGTMVATIGERGKEPGQFNFPTNIAVDRNGRLYVMDTMNFRVQVLEPNGDVVKTFGQVGDGLGQFARPKGIAVDSEGHIYVVDAAFNNFQIFDSEGRLLLFVGSIGHNPGQFWLPAGAYIDGQDRIYVADQYNFRIQVFQYLGEKGAAEAPADSEAAAAPQPQ